MSDTGTQAFSETTVAATLPVLYGALRADPDMASVYIHTLYDDPTAPLGSRGYGLLRSDRSVKPVYCAIAAANASPWSCPAGVAPEAPGAAQVKRWQAQVLLQAAADAAREVHRRKGTYLTMTSSDLHAADARISALPGLPALLPGATADPSRIVVLPAINGNDGAILCNASQADRSYCIWTFWRGNVTYGSAIGTISAAVTATTKGTSPTW